MNFRDRMASFLRPSGGDHEYKHFSPDDANHPALSDSLHANHPTADHHPRTVSMLRHYTGYASSPINSKLTGKRGNSPLDAEDRVAHEAILKHASPAGEEFHLFSGVGAERGKMFDGASHGATFHSPAHISATHDWEVSKDFALRKQSASASDKKHHMHIHVAPHDKIVHMAPVSDYPEEHETILPAGTTLKYHGTTKHPGDNVIHHFTVHSQNAENSMQGPAGPTRLSHEIFTNELHNGSDRRMHEHDMGPLKNREYHVFSGPIDHHGNEDHVTLHDHHEGTVDPLHIPHDHISSIKVGKHHALNMGYDSMVKVPAGSKLRYDGDSEHEVTTGRVAKVKHYTLL